MHRKLLVILGQTAVGKSALGVALARKYNGEIISADSRQVYIGLDIGTGKITRREMKGIPHHLLDIARAQKQLSVTEYQKLAREKVEDIFLRGKLPIIVGGTGLYINSIINDISFPEVPPSPTLRKKLDKKSPAELFEILKKLDTRRAKTIDPNNPRRLVRAIEIATALGKVPPYVNTPRKDLNPLFIGLTLPPEVLKKRITTRLLSRIKGGMVDEVKKLKKNGLSWKRMEELGLEYRYLSRYLRGLLTKEEMLKELQSEIVRYAKRQMTWFKRDKRIAWFRPTETAKMQRAVIHFLKGN
ncbi:MAG: tRNA (adenosine(37)-N6)-dimethylallyltransferase MiaA [bacterium]|nr:tRNA (adenosine(37)-N6)-dimethylallyltransferase MiaA [bacterium]